MDWFLYGNGLRHERVKLIYVVKDTICCLFDKHTPIEEEVTFIRNKFMKRNI